jgi:hypothetical protein
MWRHGIHSFLELLRHRLPASLDHMLAFIYLAYSMMALLYETVPVFEDTWIECLGDLGRYRMAIEDDDIRDREVWTGVARHWYSKASDNVPTTGRLYHHLAILARPNEVWTDVARHWYSEASYTTRAPTTGRFYHHLTVLARPNTLQQLFYYAKPLNVAAPFTSARESILTYFERVLEVEHPISQNHSRIPPLSTTFVKAHGLLFTSRDLDMFEPAVEEVLSLLNSQIGRVTRKSIEQGYHIAVANSVAMLESASRDNLLMKGLSMTSSSPSDDNDALNHFKIAKRLSDTTLDIALQRIGDLNILPLSHAILFSVHHISHHPGAMSLQVNFPWKLFSIMLNTLLQRRIENIESKEFPLPVKDEVRPFPEDFALPGLSYAKNYYPHGWFIKEKVDEEEKYHELSSMTAHRKERILRNDKSTALPHSRKPEDCLHTLDDSPINEFEPIAISPPSFAARVLRMLLHNKSLVTLLSIFYHIQRVSAMPSNWKRTPEECGPLVVNTLVAIGLGLIFIYIKRADQGRWRDSHLLLLMMITVAIGCFFIGMTMEDNAGDKLQLLFVWLFGAGSNYIWLKDKVNALPRTGPLTALCIPIFGVLFAIYLTSCANYDKGLYADQWALGAVVALPATVFISLVWVAAFVKMGIAARIEAGEFDVPIVNFVRDFFVEVVVRVAQQEGFGAVGVELEDGRRSGARRNRARRVRY